MLCSLQVRAFATYRGGSGGFSRGGGRGGGGGYRGKPDRKGEGGQRWHEPKPPKPTYPKTYLAPDCEYLYGVQPVLAALRAKKRACYNLFLLKDANLDRKDRFENMEAIKSEWAKNPLNRPIEFVESGKLESLVGKDKPNQGVVLEAANLEPPPIDYLERWEPSAQQPQAPLWVALDRIQDPQNVGAIMRSCLYFGVSGIVPTEGKSSPLNATVSKASAGALEWAPVHSAGNFGRFLRDSKANGWRIVGTSIGGSRSIPASQLELDQPTILVLGNEGTGMRSTIFSTCDTLVTIPAFTEQVDSLNVSNATAVLLYQLLGRRPTAAK